MATIHPNRDNVINFPKNSPLFARHHKELLSKSLNSVPQEKREDAVTQLENAICAIIVTECRKAGNALAKKVAKKIADWLNQ